MEKIELKALFHNINCTDYKVHFARNANGVEPLNQYFEDFKKWEAWNRYSKSKNDFNRKYIFSLISFYPEKDTWLFGGIWEVVSTDMTKVPEPYEIKIVEEYNPFIGRLKIKYEYKDRQTRGCLENHFDKMEVKEISEIPYSAVAFPGYKNIDFPFSTLKTVFDKDIPSWRAALSVKGIYLITDTKTLKKYVGKADGKEGIWGRWSEYLNNGHGGDVDLKKLIQKETLEYARKNYKFTLLEVVTGWEEKNIDGRESYWKRVLMTEFNHN